jgi:hypothetical protein
MRGAFVADHVAGGPGGDTRPSRPPPPQHGEA